MIVPRLARLMLFCLTLLLTAALSAGAVSIYTTAESDGFLCYDSYGADVAFANQTLVDIKNTFMRGTPPFPDEWTKDYGVLQFPISSLRGTVLAPNSVTLHINTRFGISGVEMRGFNFDGGGVLSPSQRTAPKTLLPTAPNLGTGGWITLDVTSEVQRQINAGYNWAGFFFSAPLVNSGGGQIYAYESGEATRPYLAVAVPEPSSLLALAGGLLSLTGLIRRRK